LIRRAGTEPIDLEVEDELDDHRQLETLSLLGRQLLQVLHEAGCAMGPAP